jgi:cation:H+ antiporter
MLVAAVLLVIGIALVLWGADRFTDGAVGVARGLAWSTFWIGVVLSGFEPENLVTGIVAALDGLPQIALGTVIGSAIFMLTGALGVALLLVRIDVRIPRIGPLAMVASAVAFVIVMRDGRVGRSEAVGLVVLAVVVLIALYRASPVFRPAAGDEEREGGRSLARDAAMLGLGTVAMVAGAELAMRGVRGLLSSIAVSETFLGMAVIGLGESLEETARMVAPARRGHPELALGNVVGTVLTLLVVNLGLIALVRPLVADPVVLRFHVPYLVGCVTAVAAALLLARRLGRVAGSLLLSGYAVYLVVNALWLR